VRAKEYKFTLGDALRIAWVLARGADLAFTRYCTARLKSGQSYNLPSLSDDVISALSTELRNEFIGQFVWGAEVRGFDFPDRDAVDLIKLVDTLVKVALNILTTRCAEGGDLRACLTDPLASDDGYFSRHGMYALPKPAGDNVNQVIYDLSLRIEPEDSHGTIKPKIVWLVQNDPWFVDEVKFEIQDELDDTAERISNQKRKRNVDDELFSARVTAIDNYIFESRAWDGKSPLEVWLDRQPMLSDPIRQCALQWGNERFFSSFWVRRVFGMQVDAVDLRDDKVHTISTTSGSAVDVFDRDMVVTSSIQPWDDEWCWSGPQLVTGTSNELEIKDLQRKIREIPRGVRRDRPSADLDLLIAGTNRHFNAWMELFGSDEVTFKTGPEMKTAVTRFFDHLNQNVIVPGKGKTPDQIADASGLRPRSKSNVDFPEGLLEDRNVTMIWNEQFGSLICWNFQTFKSAFTTEHAPTDDEVGVVREYLLVDSIDPWIFEKLITQNPAQSERLFRVVLRDSSFMLDQFPNVMQKYKGKTIRDRMSGSVKLFTSPQEGS